MSDFNPTSVPEAWGEFSRWFNEAHNQAGYEIPPIGPTPIPRLVGGKCDPRPIVITGWDDFKQGLQAWIDLIDDLASRSEGA